MFSMDMWDLLKETIPWALPVIILLSCVFEWTKIPINPLSSLFNWFSSKVTSKTDEKIDHLEKKLDENFEKIIFTKSNHYQEIMDKFNEVNKKMDERTIIEDDREMKRLKSRILVFAEDLRNGKKKAKESFHRIMEVYIDYENLIQQYNLTNGVIDEEYNFILDEYRRCREEGSFLSS